MNENKLLDEIRAGVFRDVYFIYGEEKYFTLKYVKWIVEKALNGDESNYLTMQGNPDISEFSDQVTALPMFTERKVISVCDIDVEKEDDSYIDGLLNVLLLPHHECIVLLYITSFSLDKRKEKTKRLIAAVNECGGAIEFVSPTPEKAAALLVRRAVSLGVDLSTQNAKTIAEYTLCNMSIAMSEVEKLCALALDKDEKSIASCDIDSIVIKRSDVKIYELTDAVLNYRRKLSLEILQGLLDDGFHPIMLISAVGNVFIRIYRAKSAIHSNVDIGTFIKDYKDEKQRNVEKAFALAKNVNMARLRRCLFVLSSADEQLKTTVINPDYVIQHTLVRLMEM
ncbi:DNA polymerase III subunit delta [Clostridia bacterium]|nr:DNA polymerase III subunit delta [Clostridia bacterium]